MGFFSLLFGKRSRSSTPVVLAGDGLYSFDVVGESRYQAALLSICGGRSEEGADHPCIARLIPEPTNIHDPNAIRVEIVGELVGYFSRPAAARFGKELRRAKLRGRVTECHAEIVGGWDRGRGDRGHFGVRLDLVFPLRLDDQR